MDLNHFHLQTHDMKLSIEFYTIIFEFEIDALIGDARAFLRNRDGFFLGLEQVPRPSPLPAWFHFGFGCLSEAELRRVHQRCLAAMNGKVGHISTESDPMAFYCTDPAGNQIEVFFKRTV